MTLTDVADRCAGRPTCQRCPAADTRRRHRPGQRRVTREPRSLLGYHEVARNGRAARCCLVRVLEPDAESVEVRWDDGAAAALLGASTTAGLFEGRVPFRRPLQPYRLHVRYRDGARAAPSTTRTTSRRSSSDFDLLPVRRGQPPQHLRQARRAPARCSTGSPARASPCGRRTPSASASSATVQPAGTAARHAMQARGVVGHLGAVHPGRRPRRAPTSTRSARATARTRRSRPTRYGFAMQLRPGQLLAWSRRSTATTGSDAAGCDARARRDPLDAADQHLRGAPRLVAARPRQRTPQFLNWRELADELIPYVLDMGFTHVELMPRGRAPVRRLVGLPGDRATTRRRRASARRRTSCTSSTAATRPASA
ncbi:MAG: hypothetical protein MZV65_25860 [Chromatiales bacterium]|nr:hypothetical protein [Chromatiales bacterium]